MEGMGGNMWKFVKEPFSNSYGRITEKLPMKLFSSLKIPRFYAVGS